MLNPQDEARNRQIRILDAYLKELFASFNMVNPANKLALDAIAGDMCYVRKLLNEANNSLKAQFIVEPYTIEIFQPEEARAHAKEQLECRNRISRELQRLLRTVHTNVHAPLVEKFNAIRDSFREAGLGLIRDGAPTNSVTIAGGFEALGSVALMFGGASVGLAALLAGTSKPASAEQQSRSTAPDPRVGLYFEYLVRWYDHAAAILLHNPRHRNTIRVPLLFNQWIRAQ